MMHKTNHEMIHDKFKAKFPDLAEQEVQWSINGPRAIKVRIKNRQEFIFYFSDEGDWKLETVNKRKESK